MTKQHFVILGGGISGLSLAWYLKKKYGDSIQLTVVEKGSAAGGWIRSIYTQDFLFEEGPRSCRTKGAGIATLELIEELGLEDEVIAASPNAQKRYLYTNKQLQCLPQGVTSMLCSPLTRNVVPALLKEWYRRPAEREDESIYDFFSRRLSPKIAEQFIDPMVTGIYAGDMQQLSLRSCFPQLYHWEQQYGSLTKGMWLGRSRAQPGNSPFVETMKKAPIFSFKMGMQTLVNALSSKLHPFLRYHSQAATLNVREEEIEITLTDGTSLKAARLFIALPAEAAISLLKNSFPCMSFSENPFIDYPATSVAIVNLGWTQQVLKHSGFGYLIPSKEKENILGVVWDSSVFPQQNRSKADTRLTVMMGGVRHPEMIDQPQSKLEDYARGALKKHLNIETAPNAVHVCVAKQAIPQYVLGHSRRLKELEKKLSKLSSRISLHGSAWHGVAVNDCILNAKNFVYAPD